MNPFLDFFFKIIGLLLTFGTIFNYTFIGSNVYSFFFQESGVVILRNLDNQEDEDDEGVDEVDSDSDSGLGGSVPPCSVTFIGANVSTGKSSMRSKPRDFKKVRFVGKRLPKSLICLVSNTPVDFSWDFYTLCASLHRTCFIDHKMTLKPI